MHYRKITLVIGILVALLVALTLWMAQPTAGIVQASDSFNSVQPRTRVLDLFSPRHLFPYEVLGSR